MHRGSVLLTARENFPVSSWHMALLSRWRQFKFYSSLSRTKNLPLTTERTELRAQHVDCCSDVSNIAQQEGDQRRSVAVAVSVITDSKVRTSRNIHEKKGCLFEFYHWIIELRKDREGSRVVCYYSISIDSDTMDSE